MRASSPSARRRASSSAGPAWAHADDLRTYAAGLDAVDGVVFDIGVSSMQLDQAERGFSFLRDGPLDMRMEQAGTSAADFVNTADQAALEELPGVGPVTAEHILAWREENGQFTTVDELMEVSGIGEKTLATLRPHVRVG